MAMKIWLPGWWTKITCHSPPKIIGKY